jgi:hypothetical protein
MSLKYPNHSWLIIGGSYPGLLSPLVRKKYPEKFQAAIASAGVIFASNDYWQYDMQMAITMGQECAAGARHVMFLVQKMYNSSQKSDLLRLLRMGNSTSLIELVLHLWDVMAFHCQRSHIGKFCDPFLDVIRRGKDPLQFFADFMAGRVAENGEEVFKPWRIRDGSVGSAGYTWGYITCNELGYWSTSAGRSGLLPDFVRREHFDEDCKKVFGRIPDSEKFNREHSIGKGTNLTHVAFIRGSEDPWQWACVNYETEIEEDNWVHAIVGHELGHHREFNEPRDDDPEDMKATRAHIVKLLDRWLFTP